MAARGRKERREKEGKTGVDRKTETAEFLPDNEVFGHNGNSASWASSQISASTMETSKTDAWQVSEKEDGDKTSDRMRSQKKHAQSVKEGRIKHNRNSLTSSNCYINPE